MWFCWRPVQCLSRPLHALEGWTKNNYVFEDPDVVAQVMCEAILDDQIRDMFIYMQTQVTIKSK